MALSEGLGYGNGAVLLLPVSGVLNRFEHATMTKS
jgi:hypothetical protein